MKVLGQWLGIAALLTVLSGFYLWPGSRAMIEDRVDVVMGDDTDISGLPYIYDQVAEIWRTRPSWLFHGSVYLTNIDRERGFSYWMPWMERALVVALKPFVSFEQMTTAMAMVFMILSGLAMFALARYLRWNYWLACGLAMAWAFSPFTRARAKVHTAMVGVYHVPLVFLGLLLVVRGRSWRSVALAGAAFLLACTTIHYFIVTTLFLTPLFLLFVAIQPETRAQWPRIVARLGAAAAPTVLFLAYNFLSPLPSDAAINSAQAFPVSGATLDGGLHPFLTVFAARPLDYLGGDISMRESPDDFNPLRTWVNRSILSGLGQGNSHERTNGIRWSILILAAIAVWGARRSAARRWYYYFAGFGLFAFWLALSPDIPFSGAGPSAWLYHLVSQVRVPCRAGILVHFSCLMIAGLWVASQRAGFWARFPYFFPALMLLDYPPFMQDVPMAPMRPAYAELDRDRGPCGAGAYFPFASNWHTNVLYYHFLQRMRGSDCGLINGMQDPANVFPVAERFPASMDFLDRLPHNLVAGDQLRRLAQCVPLSFIAFDPAVPADWVAGTCASLGWTLYPDLTCISPSRGTQMKHPPRECM